MPGVHSDVGGGYPDRLREDLLISPYHEVPPNRNDMPEQTMEWDNLDELRKLKLAEGWIGRFSMPVRSSVKHDPAPADLGPEGHASMAIYEKKSDHPAPRGRVELSLRMVREIRGEYSRVALRMMHRLAIDAGVPFKKIPRRDDLDLPPELENISSRWLEKLDRRAVELTLNADQLDLLRHRFVHYSAHYNPLRFVLGEVPISLILGRNFSPNAPAASYTRRIHPNVEEH